MARKRRQQDDAARALNAVRRMVRGLRSRAEHVERDLHVSAAQLFVLRELAAVPNRSVRDLAAVTMTTHSTVSQVVGQLIGKGFVTRVADTNDGRRSVLTPSRKGTELLKRAPRAIQQDLVDGFRKLTPTERTRLATGLEKWLEASGLGAVQASMLFENGKPRRVRRTPKRR
jgi:DNA-binding MarR family transcriptional regulator